MRGQMSLDQVAERVSLMMDFITVFQTVDPGLSKWRGKMLYQVGIETFYVSPSVSLGISILFIIFLLLFDTF